MPRRVAPWMIDVHRREQELAAEAKAARKARGNRLYAVLVWRADGRYDGADVLRWFRREADAEKCAAALGGRGGRGVVVRDWMLLKDPDAPTRERQAAELDREIEAAIASYSWR